MRLPEKISLVFISVIFLSNYTAAGYSYTADQIAYWICTGVYLQEGYKVDADMDKKYESRARIMAEKNSHLFNSSEKDLFLQIKEFKKLGEIVYKTTK